MKKLTKKPISFVNYDEAGGCKTQKEYDTFRKSILFLNGAKEVWCPLKLKETYSVFDEVLKIDFTISEIHVNTIFKHTIKVNDEGLAVLDLFGVELILDQSPSEIKEIQDIGIEYYKKHFEYDNQKKYLTYMFVPNNLKKFNGLQKEKARNKSRYRSWYSNTHLSNKKLIMCEEFSNQAYI